MGDPGDEARGREVAALRASLEDCRRRISLLEGCGAPLSTGEREEIAALRAILDRVAHRLGKLEQPEAATPAPAPPVPPAALPVPPSAPVPAPVSTDLAILARHARWRREAGRGLRDRPTPPPEPLVSRGFEQLVGEQVFLKLALLLAVVGVAWAFKYAYDIGWWGRLPAVAKILSGLLLSGGFLAAGVLLERRERWRAYGRGLLSAGWPLLYFTVYAAHHFPASRIVADATLALFFLAAAAGAGIAFSLRYRSEWVTMAGFALGYLTLLLSGPSQASLMASAVYTAALVVLLCRLRWLFLGGIGLAGATAVYLLWLGPDVSGADIGFGRPPGEFLRNVAWPSLTWALFAAGAHLSSRHERWPALPAHLAVANAFAYFVLFSVTPHVPDPEREYLFPLLLGMAHVALSAAARGQSRWALFVAEAALAAALVALSVPLRLSTEWITFGWTAQAAVLVILGVRLAEYPLRILGYGTLVLGLVRLALRDLPRDAGLPALPWLPARDLALAALAGTSLGLAGLLRRSGEAGGLAKDEDAIPPLLRWLGALLLGGLVLLDVPDPWTVPALAALAAAIALAAPAAEVHATGQAALAGLAAWLAALWDAGHGATGWGPSLGLLATAAANAGLAIRRLRAGCPHPLHTAVAIAAAWTILFAEIAAPWNAAAAAAAGLALVVAAARAPLTRHLPALSLAVVLVAVVAAGLALAGQEWLRGPGAGRIAAVALVALAGVAAYAVSALRHGEIPAGSDPAWRPAGAGAAVLVSAHLLGLVLLFVECRAPWIPVAWAFAGLAGTALAGSLGLVLWTWAGTACVVLGGLAAFPRILPDAPPGAEPGRILPGSLLVLALLATAALSAARALPAPGRPGPPGPHAGASHAIAGLGIALAIALMHQEASAGWLSLGWGIEGAVLLAAGFTLGARPLRLYGVGLLLAVVAKVGLLDVARLAVPYRVASFLGMSLILFGASWAYTRRRETR
ncbi:MAG: DUF2339 domain-containing protein [Planctomycetales bacterium]|nr:DUF2339 domain-containing protein [Planctomycetales bacterium]